MSAGSAACGSVFSETEVAVQHVQMEAETGKFHTGMSEVSAFGFERTGLHGFIFAVSIVCVTS